MGSDDRYRSRKYRLALHAIYACHVVTAVTLVMSVVTRTVPDVAVLGGIAALYAGVLGMYGGANAAAQIGTARARGGNGGPR